MESKTVSAPAGARIAYIDNLRWSVIAMVVLMHACVTYSSQGSWFFMEKMNQDVASTLVPTGYDRKGFLRFVADRAVRLGVPSLAFMLVLNPLIGLIRRAGAGEGLDWAMFFAGYRDFVLSGRFLEASGPLWFAVALLVFSILYAAVRLAADVVRGPASKRPASPRVITGRAISIGAVCLITIIDLVAFLLRLVQPLGTSVVNMQLGYFSSYVVLFVAGLWREGMACRCGWPSRGSAGRSRARDTSVRRRPELAGSRHRCLGGLLLRGLQPRPAHPLPRTGERGQRAHGPPEVHVFRRVHLPRTDPGRDLHPAAPAGPSPAGEGAACRRSRVGREHGVRLGGSEGPRSRADVRLSPCAGSSTR
jgi:hypothetical protein